MNLRANIEACLFVATKPISVKELIKVTGASEVDVSTALDELVQQRNSEGSGIHILLLDGTVQLVTNPGSAEVVARLAKDEVAPELTR
ncbi:MAG TPA: SMC-Scp complex subunit ScpB, partial [bacterium]|nr:SMC-Scp complex subunit ScpB [bacterium]